jgi:6-pyruvoyltetrahydropterin/6-carboxytetrahydropterin synthase
VPLHESKCRNPHGHNYVVYLTAEGDLDEVGRVIDFSVLKHRFGGWVDFWWDHGTIIQDTDEQMLKAMEVISPKPKVYVMDKAPTAENMAQHILDLGPKLLVNTSVKLTKVVLWETENCSVEVSC